MNTRFPLHSAPPPTDPALRPAESAVAYLRRARLRREQREAERADFWRRLSVTTVLATLFVGIVFVVLL